MMGRRRNQNRELQDVEQQSETDNVLGMEQGDYVNAVTDMGLDCRSDYQSRDAESPGDRCETQQDGKMGGPGIGSGAVQGDGAMEELLKYLSRNMGKFTGVMQDVVAVLHKKDSGCQIGRQSIDCNNNENDYFPLQAGSSVRTSDSYARMERHQERGDFRCFQVQDDTVEHGVREHGAWIPSFNGKDDWKVWRNRFEVIVII